MEWIIAFIIFIGVLYLLFRVGKQQKKEIKPNSTNPSKTNNLGELRSFEGEIIAYFGNGIVYNRNMNDDGGKYKPSETSSYDYDIILWNKIVGHCQSEGDDGYGFIYKKTGDLIYERESIGEIGFQHSIIKPEKGSENMFFTGDPIGAAAAYVIFCCEFAKFDTYYARYLIK